jgi:hypothetical protein
MSFSDVEAELRALNPPEFDSKCTMCGSMKGLLQWQTSTTDGCWGAVCSDCTKPLLIRLLRSRLPSAFSEVEMIHVLNDLELNKRECELLVDDFLRESAVLKTENGLTFLDDEPAVKPISESIKGSEHKHHRLSTGEIFSRCLRLSKQLLERTGTEEEC